MPPRQAPADPMDRTNLVLWGGVDDPRWGGCEDGARAGGVGGAAAASSSPSSAAAAAAAVVAAAAPDLAAAAAFPWLVAAVDSGDVGEVQRVLLALAPTLQGTGEAGRRLLHAPGGPEGLSPLALAALKGDAPIIRALASGGSAAAPFFDEPSALTGLTPLAVAVVAGQAAVFAPLLEVGCAPNAALGAAYSKAPRGTALHAAVEEVETEGGEASLLARQDELDRTLEALLAAGEQQQQQQGGQAQAPAGAPPSHGNAFDLDARDALGRTPLLLALANGRTGAATALFQRGARADAVDGSGRSALSHLLASRRARRDTSVVRALLEKGAPAHGGVDSEGMCPVFMAACNGDVEALGLLLDAPGGADAVSARSPTDGWTALHHASLAPTVPSPSPSPLPAASTAASAVRLLLEKGADPLVADNVGRVAAFFAVGAGDLDALELLLDASPPAYASSAASDGTTLLMEAASASDPPCLLLLLKRGADARAVRPSSLGPESAADVAIMSWFRWFLDIEMWPFEKRRRECMNEMVTALLLAGATVQPRLVPQVMRLLPTVLRGTPRAVEELARRRTERNRALGQEEFAGLAMDMQEMREAEAMVEARRARLRELEREVGGDDDESEESGSGSEEDDEEDNDDDGGEDNGGGEKESGHTSEEDEDNMEL